jgi:hypothetical protein
METCMVANAAGAYGAKDGILTPVGSYFVKSPICAFYGGAKEDKRLRCVSGYGPDSETAAKRPLT